MSRQRTGNGPHPVDVHVGNRIRIRRKLLGLTQRELARRPGLTFQQMHNYETAANRISAGRLHDIAALLGVPVACILEEDSAGLIPKSASTSGPRSRSCRVRRWTDFRQSEREGKVMGRRGTKDGPHPVDVHVGTRVRQRRILLGLSQEKLGACLGLTFQQVQKYERGANRIAASRLHDLSQILDVPISYFFEDLPNSPELLPKQDARRRASRSVEPYRSAGVELGFDDHKRETLELVRAYYRIRQPGVRKKLLELVRDLGNKGTGEPADPPRPTVSAKRR